ncbi:uncharacterized protein LOC113502779 [Trichoplusia ni]|uniref:Uncharacterized protein LOC113502779 n=1 Tax=Trichoplusia ni TaxID=7111 RepID=A0A7E5WJF6_TRINI|nr:uncharacterized protein LOC113502779 [Trichoplusia ni]
MSFKNKVVLITGGGAGIGAATAEEFAKEGANVAIVARTEVNLNEVAQKCEKHGVKVLTITADVSKENEVNTIVQKTIDKFGQLDVLINNAAMYVSLPITSPDTLPTYHKVLATNLQPVVQLTNLAAPYLAKTKGNIINISSVLGKSCLQYPKFTLYGMSKAALDYFSKGSALELAPSGIRVNVVSPGPVNTAMLAGAGGSNRTNDDNLNLTILNRISEPVEVADLILFLASDKAKGITGAYYNIDNGTLVKF